MAGALSLPLETERLCLRDFCLGDIDALHSYARLDEATQFLMWGPNDLQASEAQLTTFMEAAGELPRTIYELALTLKAGGHMIGAICLYLEAPADGVKQGAELGFVLHPDFWGKGLATEAAKALLASGLSELHLAYVWATCDARNQASASVLEKVGMTRAEIIPGVRQTQDGFADEYRYVFPAP